MPPDITRLFKGQVAVLWNEVGLCGLQKRDPHGPTRLELMVFSKR
jgi:hypothetical protein